MSFRDIFMLGMMSLILRSRKIDESSGKGVSSDRGVVRLSKGSDWKYSDVCATTDPLRIQQPFPKVTRTSPQQHKNSLLPKLTKIISGSWLSLRYR